MSTGSLGHSVTLLNRKEHPRYIKRISNLLPSLNRKLTTEKLQRDPIREAGSVRFFIKTIHVLVLWGRTIYIYIKLLASRKSKKQKKYRAGDQGDPVQIPAVSKTPPKKNKST